MLIQRCRAVRRSRGTVAGRSTVAGSGETSGLRWREQGTSREGGLGWRWGIWTVVGLVVAAAGVAVLAVVFVPFGAG